MAETDWGYCKECRWWQLEPNSAAENLTMGLCIDDELQPYLLRVSGISGCNRFMHGKPAHATGSSDAPPHAQPRK